MLERLAHFVVRHRRAVIGVWIVLTIFGAYAASAVSNRWLTQFSIPGYSAYEANQRTLHAFGNGEQAPMVAVFRSDGDVTQQTRDQAGDRGGRRTANPGSRVSSYFSTGEQGVRLEGRPYDVRDHLSGRDAGVRVEQLRQADARGAPGGDPAGRDRAPDRPRPAVPGGVGQHAGRACSPRR